MNAQKILLDVRGVTQQLAGELILDHVSFQVRAGERWAITGNSGSGKTALAKALAGLGFVQGTIGYDLPDSFGPNPQVAYVGQQHEFRNLSNTESFYYQQRYNSFDSEDSQTVAQYLSASGAADPGLLTLWGLQDMLEKPLIQLSNGENKRLQLVLAIAAGPAVLILDNPFTGLDVSGRATLDSLITNITAQGVLVIIVGRSGELPAGITHLLVLEQGSVVYHGLRDLYEAPVRARRGSKPGEFIYKDDQSVPDSIVRMEEVTVKYGDKLVLDGLDWHVQRGERWSVSGPNGAGKSTLLSLVTGDNPQAYSNKVWLFSKRRGTGETIWEIKKKIGYVSPELHLSFDRSNTVFEVTASGLFDTIGLFRQVSEQQEQQVAAVLRALGLMESKNKLMFHLPAGGQRLVLLARALLKQPPLLILDEPCQGLDEEQASYIKAVIDSICGKSNTTLIYISHYTGDIPACVTKHLLLDQGRVVNH